MAETNHTIITFKASHCLLHVLHLSLSYSHTFHAHRTHNHASHVHTHFLTASVLFLNNHAHCAHIATKDALSLALVQLPADDPLIIALSQNHHAHTAIDSLDWHIFGPD
jgi:hypothetical protein